MNIHFVVITKERPCTLCGEVLQVGDESAFSAATERFHPECLVEDLRARRRVLTLEIDQAVAQVQYRINRFANRRESLELNPSLTGA